MTSMSFFFFFKRKTAYEMRISDWSSDVCSSDLWASTMLMIESTPLGRTWMFGSTCRAAAVVGVFHILNHAAFKAALFMNAGIVDHEAGTRDESGRASCRARVCQ